MDVVKTLQPGKNGTKGFVELYGDDLVAVRYRQDAESRLSFTTVELIVERKKRRIQKHADITPPPSRTQRTERSRARVLPRGRVTVHDQKSGRYMERGKEGLADTLRICCRACAKKTDHPNMMIRYGYAIATSGHLFIAMDTVVDHGMPSNYS